jgi:hypothetical protein
MRAVVAGLAVGAAGGPVAGWSVVGASHNDFSRVDFLSYTAVH